jgi:dinuclear metal center YbgI/SA1388 family protein
MGEVDQKVHSHRSVPFLFSSFQANNTTMAGAVKVKDILAVINRHAPFELAESWDNVGLLIGNPEQAVVKILLGLDPTLSLVDEAIAIGADAIITHHPVIFKPLAAINTGEPGGRLLAKALTNNLAVVGCHTNFDSAAEGVSDVLAGQLGLQGLIPLVPAGENSSIRAGLGRIGSYDQPLSGEEFLHRLLKTLTLPCVHVAGSLPAQVHRVAVCGGSGSDFAVLAKALGADIYVSAEIKHNVAIWANECEFCIIDGTHYATEKPAVALLADKLAQAAARNQWNITITQSRKETPPFTVMGLDR